MGKMPNLAAVFDEHLRDEFELHDAAATMMTMSETPHLYHLPTGIRPVCSSRWVSWTGRVCP
jgi:hypothetical protein